MHRRDDDVRVWSRTLHEITDAVPEIVAYVRGLDVDTVVLDGETSPSPRTGDRGRSRTR